MAGDSGPDASVGGTGLSGDGSNGAEDAGTPADACDSLFDFRFQGGGGAHDGIALLGSPVDLSVTWAPCDGPMQYELTPPVASSVALDVSVGSRPPPGAQLDVLRFTPDQPGLWTVAAAGRARAEIRVRVPTLPPLETFATATDIDCRDVRFWGDDIVCHTVQSGALGVWHLQDGGLRYLGELGSTGNVVGTLGSELAIVAEPNGSGPRIEVYSPGSLTRPTAVVHESAGSRFIGDGRSRIIAGNSGSFRVYDWGGGVLALTSTFRSDVVSSTRVGWFSGDGVLFGGDDGWIFRSPLPHPTASQTGPLALSSDVQVDGDTYAHPHWSTGLELSFPFEGRVAVGLESNQFGSLAGGGGRLLAGGDPGVVLFRRAGDVLVPVAALPSTPPFTFGFGEVALGETRFAASAFDGVRQTLVIGRLPP